MTLFQAILEKIKAYDTIIIHRHQRPDPDAIGSQIGLKEILKTNFSDKKILATGINEPTLSWIAEMDEVPDNDYEGALVIVTDTANTPRIDDDRYDKGDFLIKIDHHPNDDAYGDLLLVDTSASSASEIVTDWALTLGLSLSDAAARVLYNGIVGDTGRFTTHLQHLKHYKSLLNFANMTLILNLWLGEWIVFLSKLLNFKAMFSIILKLMKMGQLASS